MITQHKEAFFQTAQKFQCWIALREPNALSERWIGRSGYRPKGPECKAKSADNPVHRLAGLVVNPVLMPAAFLDGSRHSALEKWGEFAPLKRLPVGFTCTETGLEKGIVRQNGLAIFADYDLMTILKSDKHGAIQFTSNTDELRLMKQVIPEINRLIGIEMVQHGPEFDPGFEGLGAREREMVLYFGPNHMYRQGVSSMPKQGH